MAENPMLSLVLYYFSADLKTTVFSEDILNRLLSATIGNPPEGLIARAI